MLVVVVDTGLGNLRSVEKAVAHAAGEHARDVRVVRSADPDLLRRAERIIVPGQGGFRDGARALAGGLGEALLEQLRAGTPYLGICLGLQLLFESSQEAPGERGLGWFEGDVERLVGGPGLKIPHMGWSSLELEHGGHRLLEAAGGQGAWMYFVHSFHAVPRDPSLLKARVSHGPNRITAAVARDNVLATQFHPEKSQRSGLSLLAAFVSGETG
jgi:imidazole glycerol-phosphate synthase subunit HisH